MDGVERIMVLGIFAVIVAILGVAAWSVTQDGGADPARASDGGALAGTAPLKAGTPDDREAKKQAQQRLADKLLGRDERGKAASSKTAKGQAKGSDLTGNGQVRSVPRPTGSAGGAAKEQAKAPVNPGPANQAKAPTAQELAAALQGKPQQKPGDKPKASKPKPKPKQRKYEVVKGDTLWAIARREAGPVPVGTYVAELKRLNPGVEQLEVGQQLKLPPLQVVEPKAAAAAPEGFTHYVVQSGDSLSTICEAELGSSSRVDEVFQLNQDVLASKHDLKVGQRLLLPAP